MSEKEILRELKEEGFKEVYIWKDKPNEVYEKHSHPYETKLVILEGDIKVNSKKLKSGNKIIIKAGELHEAIVGSNGCKYAVGERK